MTSATGPGAWRRARSLAPFLLPVALCLAAYRTSPGFELVGDAVPLIEQNPLMRDLGNLGAMATRDYFWSPAGESIGYWRPVTKVSWLLETVAGGGRPWVYQAVQVAWLAAGVAGVAALAIVLGAGPWPAGLAAAVFALHPASVEPAALVMARSDLVCAASSLWAAVAWLRWRAGGSSGALAAHLAALALAFGSKEAALALLPALAAWSLRPLRPAGVRGGVGGLVPAATVALGFLALRAHFLGAGAPVPFALEPLRFFAGTGAFLAALVPLGWTTGLRNLTPAEASSAARLAAAAAAWVVAALVAWWSWRRWRAGLGLLAWAFGALGIVLLVGPMRVPGAQDRLALADRWLFAALGPAAAFAAVALSRLPSALARRSLAAAVVAWLGTMLVVAPRLHAPYGSRLGLLDLEEAQHRATPARYRTAQDECRSAERSLLRAAAARDLGAALAARRRMREELGCPAAATADLTVLSLLIAAGRPAEALPIAEALAAPGALAGRFRGRGLALVAEALHANGRGDDALALLERAWRESPADCALSRTLARALEGAGRGGEAAGVLAAGGCEDPARPAAGRRAPEP